MTNIEKLNNRLKLASQQLRDDLDYYLEFEDLDLAFEDYIANELNHKLTNEVKEILIDISFVEPVNLDLITVNKGKKYWFKHKGKYYQCVDSWSIFFGI